MCEVLTFLPNFVECLFPGDDGKPGNRHSLASTASSSASSADVRQNGSNNGTKMSVASLGAPKSSTPLRSGGDQNGHIEESTNKPPVVAAKAPPKTLPKPKVKPVPPPKPKKSFSSQDEPLISFQDEGADGSEV